MIAEAHLVRTGRRPCARSVVHDRRREVDLRAQHERAALERGHIVLNADVSPPFDNAHAPLWRKVDIMERQGMIDLMREFQPDAVVHLAALSNDPLGNLNPACTYDINQRASIRLARLSKQAGVARFLFSSDAPIYWWTA